MHADEMVLRGLISADWVVAGTDGAWIGRAGSGGGMEELVLPAGKLGKGQAGSGGNFILPMLCSPETRAPDSAQ